MTIETLYLEPHAYGEPFGTVIRVAAISDTTDIKFEVSLEDFANALSYCLDYLEDPMKKEVLARAQNAWDEGRISDDELNIFKAVMAVIL